VEVRTTAGGPAPLGMAPVYEMAEEKLGALAASLGALDDRQARADQMSAQAWAAL